MFRKVFRKAKPSRLKRIPRRRIIEFSKIDREIFMRLKSLDRETKRRLYAYARHYINRYAVAAGLFGAWLQVYLLVIAGCGVAVFFSLRSSLLFEKLQDSLLQRAGEHFVCTLLGFVIFVTYIFFLRPGIRPLAIAPFPITVILFVLLNSSVAAHLGSDTQYFQYLWSFFFGAFLVSGLQTIIFLLVIPFGVFLAISVRPYVDSRLFVGLVNLLDKIEQNGVRWNELTFKIELIASLDSLANILERDIPTRCRTADEQFNRWATDRAWSSAAYIREMKKWIFMSREDTRSYLMRQVAAIIVCLAEGDWDGIPTVELNHRSRNTKRLSRVLSSLRTLAASIIPIGSLLLMRKFSSGNEIPSSIEGYIYFGAVAWLAIGLISLLDPLYASRLDTLKTVFQLFPTSKKRD
jgi:hypothetical protein